MSNIGLLEFRRKHILLEKPMARSEEDHRVITSAATENINLEVKRLIDFGNRDSFFDSAPRASGDTVISEQDDRSAIKNGPQVHT